MGDQGAVQQARVLEQRFDWMISSDVGMDDRDLGVEGQQPREELALRVPGANGSTDGCCVSHGVGCFAVGKVPDEIGNCVAGDDVRQRGDGTDANATWYDFDADNVEGLEVNHITVDGAAVGVDDGPSGEDHRIGTGGEAQRFVDGVRSVVVHDHERLHPFLGPPLEAAVRPRRVGRAAAQWYIVAMGSLLVRNATVLVTMDDASTEIANGGLYAVDGFIEQVGATMDLPTTADEVVDLQGHVILPGLINTHHHFYQTLTRAIPGAQDVGLFDWLRALYPIWNRLTPEAVRVSTQVALAELALSGCTTTSDHQYLFPNGSRLDDQIEGADPVGLRFHAARGSMSLGESDGGLPPDGCVEDHDAILSDTQRVLAEYHDTSPGSMLQVVVAPCSPFSVTPEIMRDSAALAREHDAHLHTHVAETLDEEAFCIETFGLRPVELMEDLGWVGPDVWYAHGVFINEDEIAKLAATGTGVAHCPSSNMRLASGIAPVRRYLDAGVRLGLGVDGSASNDSSHLIAEARQAMLLSRLAAAPSIEGGDLLTGRQALRIATRGSANVLGRNDIGSLEPGKTADFIAIALDRPEYAGALHDPVAAVVFASPVTVDHSWVHGRRVVESGELATIDRSALIAKHNRLATELAR